MKVKTYRGRSTQQVLAKVKAELGNDAVILSTQNFKEEGQNVCEVMAAIEKETQAEDVLPADKQDTDSQSPPAWSGWHQEWSQIKEYLFQLMRPQMDLERLSPRQRLVMEYLEKEGVNSNVLFKLWDKLKDNHQASGLEALSNLIRVRPWKNNNWSAKCHALAGPHGVGKTSTILRLALKAKRNAESKTVCLVNADLHQGKGRLLLRHYAELSDLHYREVNCPEDWADLAKESQKFEKIFVDLPGLSGEQNLQNWLLKAGANGLDEFKIHLVLNPFYSSEHLAALAQKFSANNLCSLIWTKLDEACNFGALLNTTFETGLPMSLFTYAPDLKNSIVPAEEKYLWKLVFKHQLPDKS